MTAKESRQGQGGGRPTAQVALLIPTGVKEWGTGRVEYFARIGDKTISIWSGDSQRVRHMREILGLSGLRLWWWTVRTA